MLSMLFFNCKVDYDIEEIAPQEHLDSDHTEHEHEHEHEHLDEEDCPECISEHMEGEESVDVNEQMEDSHAGHNHDAGARNHGTQWFFNQPWAAPFIWGKLFRDSLVFLGLAIALFIFTAKKGKK